MPIENTVMYFLTSKWWRNEKKKKKQGLFRVWSLFWDVSWNMIDQTAHTYKPDVFTCGTAAFTDIIYLVCTADSLKLCIYSTALLWKWWCCAKLFKVTVQQSRWITHQTHLIKNLNLSAGDVVSLETL